MRSIAIRTAAVFAASLAAASAVHAQGGFGPQEMTRFEVKENIYTIRNAGAGNVTVIVGKEGVDLVDNKFAPDHEAIMRLVREVTDAPLLYVINTHMHPDHVGGNPAMQGVGAAVVASENARRIMAERGLAGLANIAMRDYLRIYLDDKIGRAHV